MKNNDKKIPAEVLHKLISFMESHKWNFAKSMPKIPHWYVIRDWEDISNDEYDYFCECIQKYGYDKHFYSKTYKYLDLNGMNYWQIGEVLNRTYIDEAQKQEEAKKEMEKHAANNS